MNKFLKGVGISLLLSACFLTSVNAQHSRYDSLTFETHAYEEITSTTSATSITTATINTDDDEKTTQRAYILVTGQDVRWLCDGTTPTTSLGNVTVAGDWIQIIGLADIQNFAFIRDTASGTATCHVNLQLQNNMVRTGS